MHITGEEIIFINVYNIQCSLFLSVSPPPRPPILSYWGKREVLEEGVEQTGWTGSFLPLFFPPLDEGEQLCVPSSATVAVWAAAVSYSVILALPCCQDTTYVDLEAELSHASGFLNIWTCVFCQQRLGTKKCSHPQLLIWRKPPAHLWDRGSPAWILHLPAQRATVTQVHAPVILWTREP